jgi:hypothetical protein
MTEIQRIDKGMVAIPPVSPTKHARLMPVVFPDLPEAAAVEMYEGGTCAWMPKLSEPVRRNERYTRDDYNWDADKRWLKGTW